MSVIESLRRRFEIEGFSLLQYLYLREEDTSHPAGSKRVKTLSGLPYGAGLFLLLIEEGLEVFERALEIGLFLRSLQAGLGLRAVSN